MQNEIYSFITQIEYNMNKIYYFGNITDDMKAGESAEELKKKYYRSMREYSVLPITVLFLSMQKCFIKGMTVGAVKG